MITWQFFLPFTNSKIRGYGWKIKLLPNPVGNKPNTSFFFSSAAIHFFCSSFKQSIFGKLSRALSIASSKLNAAIFVYSSWSSTSLSRGTNWPISMTVCLMDVPALVEQQEQWTADRRFIFLFPSSRASRSYRAPREISRSPGLAHKAPVVQANDEMVRSDCFKVLRINADAS